MLKSIDLFLEAGRRVLVTGDEGAGKTLLMRLLAGIDSPGGGKASIAGVDLVKRPAAVRSLVGYASDGVKLAPELSVADTLRRASFLRGLGSTWKNALDRHDLRAVALRRPAELETPQRDRLIVALATIHDPPLLLIDGIAVTVEAGPAVLMTARQADSSQKGWHVMRLQDGELQNVEKRPQVVELEVGGEEETFHEVLSRTGAKLLDHTVHEGTITASLEASDGVAESVAHALVSAGMRLRHLVHKDVE